MAFRLIRQHNLVEKDYRPCIFLMLEDEDLRKVAKFAIRERHKPYPPRCAGGDPNTAPRLFSLEIDMRTGKAQWSMMDAEDLSGEMRPLPRHYRNPLGFIFEAGKGDFAPGYPNSSDKQIREWLAGNKRGRLEISGAIGTADAALAHTRAMAVRDFLHKLGVPTSRMRILAVRGNSPSDVFVRLAD